jgi:hypothetical protein
MLHSCIALAHHPPAAAASLPRRFFGVVELTLLTHWCYLATAVPGFSATCWFAARDLFIELGGKTAVGVIQSAAGGTAVRNWVPTEGLAHCSQPWSGLQHYGYGPYTQSVRPLRLISRPGPSDDPPLRVFRRSSTV